MDFLEDLEMYNKAMFNAYEFITDKQNVDDLIINLEIHEIDSYPLPFDPLVETGKNPAIIDMVIAHFTELEEYEKCAELVKVKNKCQNSKTPTD